MNQYVEAIEKIMSDNHIFGDIVGYSDNMVEVEITWGDWKHEHAAFRYLVLQQMQNVKSHEEITTEEDGSDCYSAIHRFTFQEVGVSTSYFLYLEI